MLIFVWLSLLGAKIVIISEFTPKKEIFNDLFPYYSDLLT